MLRMEILGPGCAKCRKLEANLRAAMSQIGVEAEVKRVAGWKHLLGKGVMVTPALSIDQEVVVQGRVPTVQEIVQYLRDAL